MRYYTQNRRALICFIFGFILAFTLYPSFNFSRSMNTVDNPDKISINEYSEVTPPDYDWLWVYNGLPSSDNRFNDVYQLSGGHLAASGGQMVTYSGYDPAWDWFTVRTYSNGGGADDNQLFTDYYGGVDFDQAMAVTQAQGSDDIVVAGYRVGLGRDFCIRRLNSNGEEVWTKRWIEDQHQLAYDIVACGSGGFAVTGYTVRSASAPPDFRLLRTNDGGIELWDYWYGSSGAEEAYSVAECANGDFVLVGYTRSLDGSDKDLWIVRVNSTGYKLWDQVIPGDFDEWGEEVKLCSDGGFAIVGSSYRNGNRDLLLVRTNSTGHLQWSKTFGGSNSDWGMSLVVCESGGFAMTGTTESYGSGSGDVWLLRTDDSGNLLWSNQWGGSGVDNGNSIVKRLDGGFVIAGGSKSWGGSDEDGFMMRVDDPPVWLEDPEDQVIAYGDYLSYDLDATATYIDTWLVNDSARFQINSNGLLTSLGILPIGKYGVQISVNDTLNNILTTAISITVVYAPTPDALDPVWERTYGTSEDERGRAVVVCKNGGFAIAGWTNSSGAGSYDGWFIRTDEFGNVLWSKTFGGADEDRFESIVECSNGDFVLAGKTRSSFSFFRAWLVRTDSQGNLLWSDAYDNGYDGLFNNVIEASDGDIVAVGSWQPSALDDDLFVQKVNSTGHSVWVHQPATATTGQVGKCIVESASGGYAIVGYNENTFVGEIFRDGWLYRIDASGGYLWDRTYDNGMWREEFNYIIESQSGQFVVTGFETGQGLATIILGYNGATGNNEWLRTYDDIGVDFGACITEVGENNYALISTTQGFGAEAADARLYRLNGSGASSSDIWGWNYGSDRDDFGNSIALCPDGGYIIAGSTTDSTLANKDIWLYRVKPVKWTDIVEDQRIEDTQEMNYSMEVQALSGTTLTWTINNTDDFTIDYIGTNAALSFNVQPPIGTYGLQILVKDNNDDFLMTNITIIIEAKAPPEWIEIPENYVHEYGNPFVYVLHARDTSGIFSWGINDTHFSITDGVIRNTTALAIGSYGIFVTVTDNLAQSSYAEFRVDVVDTTPPAWNEEPVDMVFEYETYEAIDISATDVSGVDTYWLNDSTYFLISESHTLDERDVAPVGIHNLAINVNDSIGNIQTANIRITITIEPPIWISEIDSVTFEYAKPFSYSMLAYAQGGWGNWWLNDSRFKISTLGTLSNATGLDVGSYGLHVWASDVWGNTIDTSFDVVIADRTPPTWVDTYTNYYIESGDQLELFMTARDPSGISHWIVNDTEYFTMTGAGRLVNVVNLEPGTYGVLVTVFDNYYNSITTSFSLVVTDSGAPEWSPLPEDQIAELGLDFSYQLHATDPSGIDDYWLSPTAYFSISSNGLLVNSTPLVLGNYEITAYVSDTLGNNRSATFFVTVSDNTPPTWTVTITNQGLEYGETLELQLSAYDLSGISGWSVDNTQYFSISETGLLTSSENLPVGPHQITVTVYDTYGNSNTISFYVIVSSVAAGVVSVPLAVMIMLEILGGVLILLSCVFVMAKRHGIAELPDIGDGLTGHFLKMQSELLGFSRRRFI